MTNFLLSLQITALGMGLVFGAILLLWLMMILLTFFTAEKETGSLPKPESAPVSETGFKAQAAAIAVAIALAEQGVDILRIHDVRSVRDAIVAWDTVRSSHSVIGHT